MGEPPQPNMQEAADVLVNSLQVVHQYTHLGTVLQDDCTFAYEIRVRVGRGHRAVSEVKAHLRNPALSTKAKHSIIHAFVVSVLLFQSGTWHSVSSSQVASLQSVILRALRICSGDFRQGKPQHCDEHILQSHMWPCMQAMLAKARIKFLIRLVRDAPPATIALINCGTAWKAQVREDLCWLQALHPDLRSQPSPQESPSQWVRRLSEVGGKHLLQCFSTIHTVNRSSRPTAITAPGDAFHFCYSCGDHFSTRHRLRAHESRSTGL